MSATEINPEETLAKMVAGKSWESRTHVTLLLDASGSMSRSVDDVIGGCNTFIEEQKEDDSVASISIYSFEGSNVSRAIVENINIKDCPEITTSTYRIGGNTPLYDAVQAASVKAVSLSAEHPEIQHMFVIFTDGQENGSREMDAASLQARIETLTNQEKNPWVFVYLGANQDAMLEAGKFGVAKGSTTTFTQDSAGYRSSYSTVTNTVGAVRRSRSRGRSFDNKSIHATANSGNLDEAGNLVTETEAETGTES